MMGWHWLAKDRRLQFGTHEVVKVGGVYRATGPLVMCSNGVHASRRVLDALRYAPGSICCRVHLRGEILHGTDKSVARERRVLWMVDATTLLHEFTLTVALNMLHWVKARGEYVDPRSWVALDVKERWLRGVATDRQLAAAWAAARAAEDAARAAAWAAAEDAAWTAAEGAQNTMLETMLETRKGK